MPESSSWPVTRQEWAVFGMLVAFLLLLAIVGVAWLVVAWRDWRAGR